MRASIAATVIAVPIIVLAAQAAWAHGTPRGGTAGGQAAGGSRSADPQRFEPRGSRDSGERLATRGGEKGVAACSSCHGAKAVAAAKGTYPRLEGQSPYYLRKQLDDFAAGRRPNPVMSAIAKQLSGAQKDDAAAWYGRADAGATTARAMTTGGDRRGATIALVGDGPTSVQACSNCHGASGGGEWPTVPRIVGQPAGYLAAQLRAFRVGTRQNDANAQMRSAVQGLRDADLEAVARHYANGAGGGATASAR